MNEKSCHCDIILCMNEKHKLARLEQIALRTEWTNEASFTEWLSEDRNLALLGDAINIDLNSPEIEQAAGSFSIDILAKDDNDNLVVIENQLGKTDHDHLGKLITYSSVREANNIVWITPQARDEHKQAVEWLNQRTDSKANFFLIIIELWKIGESQPAPKFNVIVAPNDWNKAIRSATSRSSSQSALRKQDFWQTLIDYANEQSYTRLQNLKTPSSRHYFRVPTGSAKAVINLNINKEHVMIQFYIHNDIQLYKRLWEYKDIIEEQLGYKLEWRELPDKRASRIMLLQPEYNLGDKSNDQTAIEAIYAIAKKFLEVFSKHLK